MGNELSHNVVGIGIFKIFCFPVKCWFNLEGGGDETLGNGCNSVAFGEGNLIYGV